LLKTMGCGGDEMVRMSEFVTENKREGKWNRHRYTHKRRWLHVGNCLWAVAVGNAAITVGNKRSGGGSISSAASWLSLYSIFLVVVVVFFIPH
jgi:hypothetical protein